MELEPIHEAFRKLGWLQAFGSSGTVRVIGDVLRRLNPESPHITLDNLRMLAERVIAAGHVDELDLEDVDSERAEVFPAGLAILLEIVENFAIDRVRVAEGAMREGLLYDLMGRFTNEDARVRSVRAMEMRYHVDALQADRVEATAVNLLEQVESDWGLEDPLAESVLRWAARLHEAGLDIAHSKYQRHSAYLLQHADMPGFPREEQLLLSALVGGHRRQLSVELLEDLLPPWDHLAEFLIVVLRLAVLLHRGRSPQPLAGSASARQRPHRDHGAAAELDEGASAHARGSRAGALLPERCRLSPEHRPGVRPSQRTGRAGPQASMSGTRSSYRLKSRV